MVIILLGIILMKSFKFLTLLLCLLLSTNVLMANSCPVFSSGWTSKEKTIRASDYYKTLSIEKGFEVLAQRMQEGPIRVEEVIGYLDANTKGSERLFDKIDRLSQSESIPESVLFRYLRSPVKTVGDRLRIQRTQIRSDRELNVFVSSLLNAVYKVDLELTKRDLLRDFPSRSVEIEAVLRVDTYIYENMHLFGRFLELAPKDAMMIEKPIFSSLVSFFFSYSNPLLDHRLNLKDLTAFENGVLRSQLYDRYLPRYRGQQLRRQIFWASLLSSMIVLPFNLAESNQALVIANKQTTYLIEQIPEIQSRAPDKYQEILSRLTQERIEKNQSRIEEANRLGQSDMVEMYRQENVELQKLQ